MKDWTKNFQEQYVLIELTDCCNLKCPMCSHVRGEPPHGGDRVGFMEFNLYKRIIKELSSKNKPIAWKLFWLGEPLLHPQLDKILYFTYEEIKDLSRKEYLDIHTNGLLLTPEITEVLLDMNYKLPRLTLSIDAASPETYERIRCGGNYQKLLENIFYFLRRRQERGQIFPTLIFQFIIMGANADETEKFVYFWIEKLEEIKKEVPGDFFHTEIKDTIWLKREDVPLAWQEKAHRLYRETVERFNLKSRKERNYELIVSDTNLWEEGKKEEIFSPQRKYPCSGPFKTPAIKWDGELTVCCFDPTFELSLGNLQHATFDELWFSPRADFMRQEMIKGDFSTIKTSSGWSKCDECPRLDTPVVYVEEIVDYLEAVGRKDMVLDFLSSIEGGL